MRFLSFLLTLWFFYLLYRIIVRPLLLFLLMFFRSRQSRGPDTVNKKPPRPKPPEAPDKKIVDAEFKEMR